MNRRTLSWIVVAVVVVGAYLYGALDDGPPRTNADRAHALAQGFACPVCAGQSVAESDVPVAREIRRQIAVWVDEGRSDGYIRDQLVAAYEADIDYNPSGSGLTSLVWILPVVAGVGVVGGLVVMLWGRRDAGRAGGGERASDPVPETDAVTAAGRSQLAVTVTVIVVIAVTAGLIVARSSGSRSTGDSITGGIRETTRELLFEAQQIVASGDIDAAVGIYDEVLDRQPSNVEALTYRGWLTARSGDLDAAVAYLEEAIEIDPDYSDAHLFRSIVAIDQDDPLRAEAELAIFDSFDPPAFAQSLIDAAELRPRILRARQEAALAAVDAVVSEADPVAFADTSLVVRDVALAAEQLAAASRLLDAVGLFDWVLASHPDDVEALTGWGWLVARTGDAELLDAAVARLDRALVLDPGYPYALVYRAFALNQQGDKEAARADLTAFDAAEDPPADLVRLIDTFNLRQNLSPP